jgi:hypothetical protein
MSRVVEQYDHPSAVIMDGRKQFGGTPSKPTFQNMALKGAYDVPLDQWISADTSKKIIATDGKGYEAGFHVYEEDKETTKSAYRVVFVRSVSARGEEGQRRLFIAREMYVPSDPAAWPPKPGEEPPKKPSAMDKIKSALKPGNA